MCLALEQLDSGDAPTPGSSRAGARAWPERLPEAERRFDSSAVFGVGSQEVLDLSLIDQLKSETRRRLHASWHERERSSALLPWLEGPVRLSRRDLQNLVDHIVIGEDEIVTEAKAAAALAMMAASRPAPSESISGEVLADVVDWRTP